MPLPQLPDDRSDALARSEKLIEKKRHESQRENIGHQSLGADETAEPGTGCCLEKTFFEVADGGAAACQEYQSRWPLGNFAAGKPSAEGVGRKRIRSNPDQVSGRVTIETQKSVRRCILGALPMIEDCIQLKLWFVCRCYQPVQALQLRGIELVTGFFP